MHRSNASSLPALPLVHVPRPRLAAAPDTGIVCVLGGAGWGKSVLLRELCEGDVGPVLWITLDTDPGTAAELWRAVVRSVTELVPGDDAMLASLHSMAAAIDDGSAVHGPPDAWFARDLADRVAEILHEAVTLHESVSLHEAVIAARGAGRPTIVVDDLHDLEHGALAAWWAFVERISASVRVVMASRHAASFPLPTWRLRDDVHVVDEWDLAYDAAETAAVVLALAGEHVTDEVAGLIVERTEGWPTGVQHHRQGLHGDDVMRRVLGRLAPDVRQFLSDTSILAELTIDACHALSGRSDAGALLREMTRASVFTVPLDAEAETYRYRRPFQELLRTELLREQPDRWESLHRRAAEHHLAKGAVGTAASHLVDIGDHRGALSLLLQHHSTVMEMAQHMDLAPLLARVPLLAIESDAQRTFALGFLLASSGHIAAGRRLVETLVDTELDPELRRRARWVRLLAACSLGDVGDDDLELLPQEPPDRAVATFWRELPIALVLDDRLAAADDAWADGVRWGLPAATEALLQVTTEIFLGAWRGRIRDVIPDTAEAEEDLLDARDRPRAVYIRVAITRGMIETELGDPMEAVARLDRTLAEFEGRVIPHSTQDVPLFRTILRALRLAGHADLALSRGREFEGAIDRRRPRLRRLISEEVVRSACAVGDLDAARLARRDLSGPCSGPLADAWIAIAQGDPFTARSAVAGLEVTDLSIRAPSRAMDLLEVRARTAPTTREREDLVAAAARLADEHGLLRSFESVLGTLGSPQRRSTESEAQPLSDRELDVLRGLASGVSHRVLAATLDVSHNTLKTHLRAVYRKLGALDRDDAVLRARTAGLLSSPSADPAER